MGIYLSKAGIKKHLRIDPSQPSFCYNKSLRVNINIILLLASVGYNPIYEINRAYPYL